MRVSSVAKSCVRFFTPAVPYFRKNNHLQPYNRYTFILSFELSSDLIKEVFTSPLTAATLKKYRFKIIFWMRLFIISTTLKAFMQQILTSRVSFEQLLNRETP